MTPINRGFRRRDALDPEQAMRLPPGRHLVSDFPVLTCGPTPIRRLEDWTLRIDGAVDRPRVWTWEQFHALPSERFTTDVPRCHFMVEARRGVGGGLARRLARRGGDDRRLRAGRVRRPLWDKPSAVGSDRRQGLALRRYDDEPLELEHGGPARLLVPYLYLWVVLL